MNQLKRKVGRSKSRATKISGGKDSGGGDTGHRTLPSLPGPDSAHCPSAASGNAQIMVCSLVVLPSRRMQSTRVKECRLSPADKLDKDEEATQCH